MTAARDDGRRATGAEPRRFFSGDVVVGLGAALVWSAITFVLLGASRSGAAGFTAFVCASSSTVPLVIVARRVRGIETVAAIVLSAPISLVPVAVFGSLIQTHTHHRALGAVTFAVGAVLAIVVTFLLAWRIIRSAASGAPVWRALRGGLVAACASSIAWAAWTLTGPSSPSSVREAALDGAIGLVTVVILARNPPWDRLPSPIVRMAPALFAIVLGLAVVLAWKNAPSFATLCERAPLTLGIFGVFACR